MTPLTKETVEATSQTAESAVPRTVAPAPNPTRQRSEAVSLEIPIKVHGSRVTEVVMGITPHTEPFEEQSTTMIVFAQGGVLKMSTPVTTGQMMVLTNLKTRQDVICRVLKVRNNPNLQSYVEIEFTHPQPGYWGVFFPSDDSESAPQARDVVSASEFGTENKGRDRPGSLAAVCKFADHVGHGVFKTACRSRSTGPVGGRAPSPASYVAPPPRPGQHSYPSARRKRCRLQRLPLCRRMRGPSKLLKKTARSTRRRRVLRLSRQTFAPQSPAPAFSGASVAEMSSRSRSPELS